jgi:hypothetical protein
MNENTIYSLALDMAFDAYSASELLAILELYAQIGIAIKVLQAEGPGGGHPLCEIIGTKAAITTFIDNYYGGDLNLLDELEIV